MMLHSIHQVNGQVDPFYNMLSHNGASLDILNTPAQLLQTTFAQEAVDARWRWTCTTRSELAATPPIDREILQKMGKGRSDEDKRILRHCLSSSSWDNSRLFNVGQAESPVCDLCGYHTQTHYHLLYDCPALETQRRSAALYVKA